MHNRNTPKPMDPSKLRLGSFKNTGIIGRFAVGNAAPVIPCLLSKLIQISLVEYVSAKITCYPIQFTAAPSSVDHCSRRFWPNGFVLAPRAAVVATVAPERYHQVIYPHNPFRVHKNYRLGMSVQHTKYGANMLLTSCFWTPTEIDDIHCLI